MTDHKALTYIFTQPKPNAMISRWHETLLAYDFEIIHIPGIKNVLPDVISRMYPPVASDRKTSHKTFQTKIIDPKKVLKTMLGIRTPSDTEKLKLMKIVHDQGHFGIAHMLKSLWFTHRVW